MRGSQQMAPDSEQILDHAVGRGEALQMGSRFKAARLALQLPGRLMRDLGPVVRILIGAVNDGRHDRPVSRRVAAQIVGDQPAGGDSLAKESHRGAPIPLFLQQLAKESHRGAPIPSRLDQDLEHVAVLVDCSPQVLLATVEGDEYLIEIPRVSEAPAPLPEPSRIHAAERTTPPSNRLIGDCDAPLGQEVLNISKTEVEAKVEPDRVSDDVWRESIAVVAGCGAYTAAQMLIIFGDNPDRIRSEAAFAKLCGACPIPASSGMTTGRHRAGLIIQQLCYSRPQRDNTLLKPRRTRSHALWR